MTNKHPVINLIEADLSRVDHGDAIIQLLSIYALDPMGGGEALSDFATQNLISELRKRHDVLVLLAFDGHDAVGLVNCFEGFSTFACKPLLNIHDVVVRPEYRGQCIAKQMLGKVEELARSRGCCKLTLEVLEANQAARAAYASAGFEAYQLDPAMGHALFWEKKLD